MLAEDEIELAESNGHSIYGASGWSRKLVCAGSVIAEYGLPDTAGFKAAEGTVAHEIAAEWLAEGLRRQDFLPRVGTTVSLTLQSGTYEIQIDRAMIMQIERYADWCLQLPGDHMVEQFVDFSPVTPIPRQGGTADFIAMQFGHLDIVDFKYGVDVMVYAEDNDQARGYALGVVYAWDWLYDFQTITIRICQPRRENFGEWTITKTELLDWAENTVKPRLAATWDRDAPRTPSEDACRFCKARATCPAVLSVQDALADNTFDDVTISPDDAEALAGELMASSYEPPKPRIKALTTDQLGKALRYRKYIEHTFEAMYEELRRRVVEQDEPIPDGWMMAEGKTERHLLKSRAKRILVEQGFTEEDLYEQKERTPASLEKLFVENGFRKAAAVAILKSAVREKPGQPTLSLAGKGKTKAVDLADESFDVL